MALLTCAAACAPPGKGREEVRFWALGREGEVVQQLLPEFERRNPGVHVTVQQIPWTAAHEKLLTAYVGDATPDLAQIGNTWVPELEALKALQDLSPLIARSPVVRPDSYFAGVWDTGVIDGKTWGVPWYVDTRVLFYRKDILARAGVTEVPRTWAAWIEAMKRVKSSVGPDRFAILLPTDEWAQPVILAMQAGSTLLRDGGRFGAFRAPEFRHALELYISLFRDRLAPALGMNQVANVYQQFAEGYFAMYITGPWNLGEFRRRLPPNLQDVWATAPLPAERAGDWPGVSLAGGSSLVVFGASKHQDAAWKLIEFLSEPSQQGAFYALTGDLPAVRAAWNGPALAADPLVRAFFTQLEHTRPVPKIPEWEQIAWRTAEVAEQALRGRISVDEAAVTLDHEVDRMLDKRRYLLDRKRTSP
ncbi:MAG TPA: sugar ABC transporter substrate-binding protein [Thermoanaerobaculaceae bacterium]|nr:sugar ABC transporter substrate-binding protein [Thermoanaerobaculaceae bacterium]